MYIYDNMLLNCSYNENVLEKFVEKIRTQFYDNIFLSPKIVRLQIMSKNMVGPDRPRNTAQVFCMLDN